MMVVSPLCVVCERSRMMSNQREREKSAFQLEQRGLCGELCTRLSSSVVQSAAVVCPVRVSEMN